MIRPGEPWGEEGDHTPDLVLAGDDRALADAVRAAPGATIWFRPRPSSDLARALGLRDTAQPGTTAVTIDALRVVGAQLDTLAVNAVVLGVAPDRQHWWSATTTITATIDGRPVFDGAACGAVIATGEYLRGADLVPRGHPGDGRAETQVYALAAGQRGAMRRRLVHGQHLPHPRIRTASGRLTEVVSHRSIRLELDGRRCGTVRELLVEVVPAACTLLV